jgi:hypothetical protein
MKTVKEQPLEQLREGPGRRPGQGPLLEVFLGQFDRLKRFVMGMGLGVSDAEDVLQAIPGGKVFIHKVRISQNQP